MLRGVIAAIALLSAQPALSANPETDARVELTSGAALYGVGLGLYVSLENDLRPRPAAWVTAGLTSGLLFGAWKATGAFKPNRDQARFIESSALWATGDAMLFGLALGDSFDDDLLPPVAFTTLPLAAAAAALSTPAIHASVGQTMLANSLGLTTPIAGILLGATLHLGDGEHLPRDLLVMSTAGIAAAVALNQRYRPTQEQVLTMDAGILLGGLVSELVALIFWPMTTEVGDGYEGFTFMGLAGMVAGAAVALKRHPFSRHSDVAGKGQDTSAPSSEASLALMVPVWATAW